MVLAKACSIYSDRPRSQRRADHLFSRSAETPLPLYFFDLSDSQSISPDDTGLELPDIDAAKRALAMTLPRLSADRAVTSDRLDLTMTVRDEGGHVLLRAELNWSIQTDPH